MYKVKGLVTCTKIVAVLLKILSEGTVVAKTIGDFIWC